MKRSRLKRKGSAVKRIRLKADGWKSYSVFMSKAGGQFSDYERTGDLESLGQAGEKLWNAFNLLMERKAGRKIRSYPDMKKFVAELYGETGSETLLNTFRMSYGLHVFFYRGYTDDVRDVENDFKEVKENIRVLERSLK